MKPHKTNKPLICFAFRVIILTGQIKSKKIKFFRVQHIEAGRNMQLAIRSFKKCRSFEPNMAQILSTDFFDKTVLVL